MCLQLLPTKLCCSFVYSFSVHLQPINTNHYYPTLFRRVQITHEMSTDITRYLYLSPFPRPCERLKTLASQNFGETKMLDYKSLISHFSVQYHCKFSLINCILTLPSGSPKYCMTRKNPGGGVLPYIRYIGMCRPKGYGF